MKLISRHLKNVVLIPTALLTILVFAGETIMAQKVQEAKYTTVTKDGDFEIRDYAPRVVAETYVESDFTEASNIAFNRLFGYISGRNKSKTEIAMTAPVTQQTSSSKSGVKIDMTAPVTQEKKGGKYRVTFILPASFTIKTAPAPLNTEVIIVAEPGMRAAVVNYAGRWTKSNYDENLSKLQNWITSNTLTAVGTPIWARYDPPFSLPVFRRNEILIPVKNDK